MTRSLPSMVPHFTSPSSAVSPASNRRLPNPVTLPPTSGAKYPTPNSAAGELAINAAPSQSCPKCLFS